MRVILLAIITSALVTSGCPKTGKPQDLKIRLAQTDPLPAGWSWVLSKEGKPHILAATDFVAFTSRDAQASPPPIVCATEANKELHDILEEAVKRDGHPKGGTYFTVSTSQAASFLRFSENESAVDFKAATQIAGPSVETKVNGNSTSVALVAGTMPLQVAATPEYKACLTKSAACASETCPSREYTAPTGFGIGALVVLAFTATSTDGSALANVPSIAKVELKVSLASIQLQYNQWGETSVTSNDLLGPLKEREPDPTAPVGNLQKKTTRYATIAVHTETFTSSPRAK